MTTVSGQAAPGWYPVSGSELRYWNGTGWTGQVRQVAPSNGAARCAVCGAQALVSREKKITEKKRKWRVTTGLLVRTNVLLGVDRWLECTKCGARQ